MSRFFIAMLFISFLASKGLAQIDVRFQNASLEEALLKVESQSDYRFQFHPSWLDSLFVTGSFSGNMEEVLSEMLKDTRLNYVVAGSYVILIEDAALRTQLPVGFFNDSRILEESTPAPTVWRREEQQQESSGIVEGVVIGVGRAANFRPGQVVTLAGYVRELESGEPILGALVYVKQPFVGVTTDSRGYYSLKLPSGRNDLNVQFAGMRDIIAPLRINESGTFDFAMVDDVIALKEVTIESERDANVDAVELGVTGIEVKSIKSIPLVLGEPDVFKVAETLPGVQSVGEGSAGFNVRGGRVDQNLISIEGATVYNPYHFFGFFSILNSSVIKKMDIYKGSIPAKFGGRLSSYFDIQMKDGNQKRWSGVGNISPVTAGLTLEGPIVKDKTSVILGGRTTYSNWVLNLVPDPAIKNSDVFFYDMVGKITHKFSEKDQLFLSGYYSRDRFNLSTDSLFSYRNANGSLTWRHNFNDKLISEVSGSMSDYRYNVEFLSQPTSGFNAGFKVNESNLKIDFDYFASARHKFRFGFQSRLYRLEPGFIDPSGEESLVVPETIEPERGLENAFYFADNFEVSPRLALSLGLRYSFFSALGPKTVYTYDPNFSRDTGTITDTTNVRGNGAIKTYHGPEYRLSARFKFNDELSIKAGYNKTRQYIHQLTNSIAVAPTDVWKLSDTQILPQVGDQVSVGLFKNFLSRGVETSVEAFYKRYQNIVDFKTGADLTLNQLIETEIIQGDGKAYGAEFLLRKKTGKLNGWVSYTYSRALIRLDGPFPEETVNQGQFFPANFDKPHDLSVVSNFKLTRRYSISANFIYSTGKPITFPVAKFQFGGAERVQFSERNQFRVPDYFRIDIGLNIEGNHKKEKVGHSFWNISVYNLTGRKNVYSVFFTNSDGQIEARQLSIFGSPIPTITYNFRF